MNIEFTCANCGAGLKVLRAFAGKNILCPKCTKKTPVPGTPVSAEAASVDASPPSPASPPASASKSLVEDGVYVSFACANCGTALKVLKSFAGRSIQCPKCAKKTTVPGGPAKPDASPTAKPAAAPAVPAPESVVPPAPPVQEPYPPVVAPLAGKPDEAVLLRLREQERTLENLTRDMKEMERRLDVARLRAERAEQEKQELADQKAVDRKRMEAEVGAHFQAELRAAQKTIARMEEQIREATAARLSETAGQGRTAAEIEKELLENPDSALTESETLVPDAVLSDIRQSCFGRYLRLAVLLHVIVLGLSSVVYIKNRIAPPPEEPEAADSATNAPPATVVGAPVEAAPASGVILETGEVSAAAAVAPPPRVPVAVTALETLPAPGEQPPTDTQVSLGL